MRERIEAYARKLEGLSTVELSRSAERLASRERRYNALLIAHLAEISRRKGHLELGYGTLFTYCQERLGLGEGEVWMRTQVAGVARRFPPVLEHLAAGKVSLSVLGILAAHLDEENVDRLLEQAAGATTREVKEIVAALRPKPAAKPAIRREPGGEMEVARPEVYNFRFSAGKEFREKLERLAEVLGVENATARMPELLEKALDLALEKKDPRKKLERRRKRERSPGSAGGSPASSPRANEARGNSVKTPDVRSRYVPSAVRERLLARASYRCEYTGTGGLRCTARVGLGAPSRRGRPPGVQPFCDFLFFVGVWAAEVAFAPSLFRQRALDLWGARVKNRGSLRSDS